MQTTVGKTEPDRLRGKLVRTRIRKSAFYILQFSGVFRNIAVSSIAFFTVPIPKMEVEQEPDQIRMLGSG